MDYSETPTGSPHLLVFADDWGRHPSSCQHLIRQLLPKYAATWVNTIGTRAPRLDLVTLLRGVEKLRQWTAPKSEPQSLPENLNVLKPLMWPWLTRPMDRWINQRLLVRQLNRCIRSLDRPVIAITTLPIVAGLMGPLDVARWVYYCVDDFSQWPGLDQKAMEEMERAVIRQADVLVAASESLQTRLLAFRDDVALMTHGVDLDHWRQAGREPLSLEGLEPPYVVYWGLLDRRMDTAFLEHLSAALTKGTILLVGREQNSDPALSRLPRVRRIAAQRYEDLPALAAASSVLIMPYADLPVTRAMQPLKLLQYLATGKPVVVRDLPSTVSWGDCLDVARTAEEFTSAVIRRLQTGLPDGQRRSRERLSLESWESKAAFFEKLVLQSPAPVRAPHDEALRQRSLVRS
jgi:glycosyltransferase involved in cell wall biosynthesis